MSRAKNRAERCCKPSSWCCAGWPEGRTNMLSRLNPRPAQVEILKYTQGRMGIAAVKTAYAKTFGT